MAQEMYKHDALLHLLWAVAAADSIAKGELGEAWVTSSEYEFYEKVRKAEGIDIDLDVIYAKRNKLSAELGDDGLFNEALKATNGCGREWKTKVYGYMWRMANRSWEGEMWSDGKKTISEKEFPLLQKAAKYFGVNEELDKALALTQGIE